MYGNTVLISVMFLAHELLMLLIENIIIYQNQFHLCTLVDDLQGLPTGFLNYGQYFLNLLATKRIVSILD